jgi:hypothetical protein
MAISEEEHGMSGLSQVPPAMVGGVANLPDLLVALATLKGVDRSEADRVVKLLPDRLKEAPCFLDRLTARWRYVYGVPFDGLQSGQLVYGTHMYLEASLLFDILSCAEKRLPPDVLKNCLTVVGDPIKHGNALIEFAPILRLDSAYIIEYEVHGEGNFTIDWLISAPGERRLLLEVKNRVKDIYEGLCNLQLNTAKTSNAVPEPAHDHNFLFCGVEKKFPISDVSKVVQGVWIKTEVKQEETELYDAFERLDPQRIHFAVLGDWENDAYIMAHDEETRHLVARLLHVKESRRFVFLRGASVEK